MNLPAPGRTGRIAQTRTMTLTAPPAARRPFPRVPALSTIASALALALALLPGPDSRAANYGASVVSYLPGTGAAPGYDQPQAALGEPSRITPGEFGSPVDPFSSPWQPGQLLSVGSGGSLTLQFQHPVLNQPGNPFGLDFMIFTSAAFMIVNGDFTGGGITDGSLFGDNAGSSRVSVSADGSLFFTLDPARAPKVDGLFPTDGSGDFALPVDPSLAPAAFDGLGLAGIRNLYAGSGGGTGYDLGWARDAQGQPVNLDSILFVRIEIDGDRAEIDAVSAVPEPGTVPLLVLGGTLVLARRRPVRNVPGR